MHALRRDFLATVRESVELINLLLKKVNHPFTLEELIAQLGSDQFRQVYIGLDPELQHQIEIIVSPPTLLRAPGRRARKESEIWQQRQLIHQLKTEPIQTGEDTKRRTWEEVTVEIHSRGILTHKTKDQIYWTLRDKRDDATLTPEDKQLLEDIFVRLQRGSLKLQVERMADIISVARQRHTWHQIQTMLVEFASWQGTVKQLVGAYFRACRPRTKP